MYIILALLTLVFFRNVFPKKGQIIQGWDLVQTYYQKFIYKNSLLKGQLPIWNPYIYNGYPYIAHPYNQVVYPLNLIFLTMPINKAYTWSYILHTFLAGSFMYMLMNHLLNPQAALFSAICFMFSGFMSCRIWAGHYEVLCTSIWIPLVFLLYITNHPILCALALAIQFFAGHNQTSFFTFIILLSCAVYNASYARFAIIMLLFILFSLKQLLLTISFAMESTRSKGVSFKHNCYGSFPPSHLLRFLCPDVFGNFLKTKDYGDPVLGLVYWEHTYYIGFIPLMLALMWFDWKLIYWVGIFLMIESIFRCLWDRHILHI